MSSLLDKELVLCLSPEALAKSCRVFPCHDKLDLLPLASLS